MLSYESVSLQSRQDKWCQLKFGNIDPLLPLVNTYQSIEQKPAKP